MITNYIRWMFSCIPVTMVAYVLIFIIAQQGSQLPAQSLTALCAFCHKPCSQSDSILDQYSKKWYHKTCYTSQLMMEPIVSYFGVN